MIMMTKMAIEATADQVQKLSTWQQTAPTGQLAASDYHPHDGDDDVDDDHDAADDNDDDVESSTVLSSDQLSFGTACVLLNHFDANLFCTFLSNQRRLLDEIQTIDLLIEIDWNSACCLMIR